MNSRITIKNLLTRISIIVILLSAMAAGTFAQTVLVSDAYTSATSANGNFGTNPTLNVSANNTAYVKFEIARTLPADTKRDDIARATVKFYVNKVATAGKLDVYPIMADWDEKTITANNAPPIGSLALTTQQIGNDDRGNYVLVDITDMVKQWFDGGSGQDAIPNYGFALAPHPVDPNTPQLADISLDSKENSQTSHDGMLSVQLKSGAQGLQAVTTDATLTGDGTAASPLGVATGAITSNYLADGAVTTAKIVDGAVTSGKIADNAVGTTKLADNAVGTTKIVDGSVTSAKITVPLSLIGVSPDFTLSVANTGTGPALTALGAINTSTQYNIGGARILSNAGANNLIAGVGAGAVNAGQSNAFFGNSAGLANVNGDFNSFFGSGAGRANLGGDNNSFFGSNAGLSNTGGFQNSFFGREAGANNTGGSFNSFFGRSTGLSNTTGEANSFFGQDAGIFNTTGGLNAFYGNASGRTNTTGRGNSFFGMFAGDLNTTGSNNTGIGIGANVGANNLTFATAVGASALVASSNSLVLGGIAGVNGSPADTNVGIGTTAPKTKLHIRNGKMYLEANGQGMILKSPSGSCFELTVSDAGALTITPTACP
ncbi:MAG TPA: DNRLRE domain-containing protein [Blastocatellia bacterium]|nr:DNRLRE domain-containing protein [Blastocatellia bacterium]